MDQSFKSKYDTPRQWGIQRNLTLITHNENHSVVGLDGYTSEIDEDTCTEVYARNKNFYSSINGQTFMKIIDC